MTEGVGTDQAALIAGRYRVVRQLGSGGMGSVLLAEDERLQRPVAIKRMHPEGPADAIERFRREARLGASLNHRNLVTTYDAIVEDDEVMIVMEYVPGPSLAEALREGPLEPARAVGVLRDVAAALDDAHSHGVLHRDVKPANILLAPDGRAMLADLGVATAVESTKITIAGGVIGTAAYLAPEQFDGGKTTEASDVYALAAVAYEMLAGRRARAGRTPLEIARAAAAGPADLRELDPTIPEAVAEALCRGMATEPHDRPHTAGALAAEVARPLEAARPAPATHQPSTTLRKGSDPPAVPRASRDDVVATAAAPPRAPAAAAAPADRERSRSRLIPALLAGLLAIGALVLVLALGSSGGGGGDGAERQASDPPAETAGGAPEPGGEEGAASAPEQEGGAASPEAAPEPGAEAAPEAAAEPGPARAVRAFYERAAADDFTGAYESAAAEWQAKLGGSPDSVAAELGTLEEITFGRLEVVDRSGSSATVAVETTARHAAYTDRCTGTIPAVREGGRWRMGVPAVSCRRA